MQAQTPDSATLRTQAEQGDVVAQWRLGVRYEYGTGVPQDAAEAARWYRLAAEQGYDAAQYSIGVRYANGDGVPKDDAEAARWLRRAAEQGHIQGQFSLAFMFVTGRGVSQDDGRALRWYRLAEQSCAEEPCIRLPDWFRSPDDAKGDAELARWYRLAAEHSNVIAQWQLGLMYADGRGVPQDLVQAHMWVNLAATRSASARRYRNEIQRRMTPDQLTEAQRLATAWDAAHPRWPLVALVRRREDDLTKYCFCLRLNVRCCGGQSGDGAVEAEPRVQLRCVWEITRQHIGGLGLVWSAE